MDDHIPASHGHSRRITLLLLVALGLLNCATSLATSLYTIVRKLARLRTLPLLLLLAVASVATSSFARDIEPRYLWQPNITQMLFNSKDEAFQFYKEWVDANNAPPSSPYHMTVLDYVLVGTPGTSYYFFNGVPTGYQFEFLRPADCQQPCLGNGMYLQLECPKNTQLAWSRLSQESFRYSCTPVVTSPPPEPDPDCCKLNPVYPSTGLKQQVEIDYPDKTGTLLFSRIYRSDRNGWANNYQSFALDLANSTDSSNWPNNACVRGIGQSTGQSYCFHYMSGGASNDFIVQRGSGRLVTFDSVAGTASSL